MPESSHFPPERMRRICRLLDVRDAKRARQLKQDLLGILRIHLLRKAEEDVFRLSEIRQELRSGIKIIGAAARWVESLSGFAQQALEEAFYRKQTRWLLSGHVTCPAFAGAAGCRSGKRSLNITETFWTEYLGYLLLSKNARRNSTWIGGKVRLIMQLRHCCWFSRHIPVNMRLDT
jgi:hypothetical protein